MPVKDGFGAVLRTSKFEEGQWLAMREIGRTVLELLLLEVPCATALALQPPNNVVLMPCERFPV